MQLPRYIEAGLYAAMLEIGYQPKPALNQNFYPSGSLAEKRALRRERKRLKRERCE
jgi:hypothetical protein